MKADETWVVELEHRVGGPPETVFEYFTDPEKYKRWKGQDARLDARPGGVYEVTMAPDIWVRGNYVVVDPPKRVVMTWGFESPLGLPRGLSQVPPGTSTVEFTFVPDGDGTIVRVRHTGLPTGEAQWAHELGWNTYLARLTTVRNGADPGEEPTVTMGIALYEREAQNDAAR